MSFYNPGAQGFGQQGGVPYNGAPAVPQVTLSPNMQPFLPTIISKMHQDMANRQTAYSNYMLNVYAQNSYSNPVITKAAMMIADLVEYRAVHEGVNPTVIMDDSVNLINTISMMEYYRSQNGQIPVSLTPEEQMRMTAADTQMQSMKPALRQFAELRNANQRQANNILATPTPNQMSQQGFGFPTQPSFGQPTMPSTGFQGFGQPQGFQGFGQPQNNAFQGFQGFGHTNPAMQQINNNLSRMATGNPHQIGVMNQMTQMNKPLSSPGIDAMPAIDVEKLHRIGTTPQTNAVPTHHQSMDPRPTPPPQASNSYGGFDHLASIDSKITNTHATTAPKASLTYEQRVNEVFKELGYEPGSVSFSMMEDIITQQRPDNGFIDKRNAFSELKTFNRAPEPTGAYKPTPEEVQSVITSATASRASSFAEMVHQTLDTKPGDEKVLIKQPGGTQAYVRKSKVEEFNRLYPELDITQHNINAPIVPAPYPFAERNLAGSWIVSGANYKLIPANKRGIYFCSCAYISTTSPFYIVDNDGKIVGFYVTPNEEDLDMNFNDHDDTKFFPTLSVADVGFKNDDAKTLEAFANLQVEQKVEEVISSINEKSGIIEGDDSALVINTSVVVDEQVSGSYVGDDYYSLAYAALTASMADVEYLCEDISIRYKHVHMYPWSISENDLKLISELKHNTDYLDIARILEEINSRNTIPSSWFTRLNDVATRFINNVLFHKLNLPEEEQFYIRSYSLDIDSAIERLEGIGYDDAGLQVGAVYDKTFAAFAKELTNTLLYIWDSNKNVFTDYHYNDDNIEDMDTEDSILASMGIVRDVTVLPIHSRDIDIHVNEDNVCILTKHGFKNLWEVARMRLDNKFDHASEVLFVTTDNRAMYLHETTNPDIILVTQSSLFE